MTRLRQQIVLKRPSGSNAGLFSSTIQVGCFCLLDGSLLHSDSRTEDLSPCAIALSLHCQYPFHRTSHVAYLTTREGRKKRLAVCLRERNGFGEQSAISATSSVFRIKFRPSGISILMRIFSYSCGKCCFCMRHWDF